MMGVLTRRGILDTETHIGRRPCEDEGSYQGDASTSHRLPAIHQKLGQKHGTDSHS